MIGSSKGAPCMQITLVAHLLGRVTASWSLQAADDIHKVVKELLQISRIVACMQSCCDVLLPRTRVVRQA